MARRRTRTRPGARPEAVAPGTIKTVRLLIGPAFHMARAEDVEALVFAGWAVHERIGPVEDGGFCVTAHGLSLDMLCADIDWLNACRLAVRLATDFPDPEIDNDGKLVDAFPIMSAVAEFVGELMS